MRTKGGSSPSRIGHANIASVKVCKPVCLSPILRIVNALRSRKQLLHALCAVQKTCTACNPKVFSCSIRSIIDRPDPSSTPAPATNTLLHFSAFASCLDVDYYTVLVPVPRFMTLQLHSRAANLWPETYVKSHTTPIALPNWLPLGSSINYRHCMQCLSAVLPRRISRKTVAASINIPSLA